MGQDYTAKADTLVEASVNRVWTALTDPKDVKEYLFGTNLKTDWKVGSPVTFEGEYDGHEYKDKGEVKVYDEPSELAYTYWSSMSGKDDQPSNYGMVTFKLTEEAGKTRVSVSQTGNDTEESRDHSEKNWKAALEGLKKVCEG